MNSRDLNILALPEPIKLSFQKRIDEIGVGLHRRFDALLPDKADQFDLAHINHLFCVCCIAKTVIGTYGFDIINHLFCVWDGFAIDFERGIDMNFGRWQDEMELIYKEIIEALTEAEETAKKKGGEKS